MKSAIPKVLHPSAAGPWSATRPPPPRGSTPTTSGRHRPRPRAGRPPTSPRSAPEAPHRRPGRSSGTGHAVSRARSRRSREPDGIVVVTTATPRCSPPPPCARCSPAHAATGNAVTVLTAERRRPDRLRPDPPRRRRRASSGDRRAQGRDRGAARHQRDQLRRLRLRRRGAARRRWQADTDNDQGERYLTDVVGIAARDGDRVGRAASTTLADRASTTGSSWPAAPRAQPAASSSAGCAPA